MRRERLPGPSMDLESKVLLKRLSKALEEWGRVGASPQPIPTRSSSVDVWSTRLATWSQPLMLAVVIFGYVMTVRPAFQKEQLSEDVARLQLEQRKLEGQIDVSKKQIVAGRQELEAIKHERDQMEQSVSQLKAERVELLAKVDDASRSAESAARAERTAIRSLQEAQDQVLRLKRVTTATCQIGAEIAQRVNSTLTSPNPFRVDEPTRVAERLQPLYAQPLQVALETAQVLRQGVTRANPGVDTETDKRLIADFEDGIAKRRDELTCPAARFELWQDAYSKAVTSSAASVDSCTTEALNAFAKYSGMSQRELEKGIKSGSLGKILESERSLCKSDIDIAVGALFYSTWVQQVQPCTTRAIVANAIALGTVDAKALGVVSDFQPPDESQVSKAIAEAIKNRAATFDK